MGAIDLAHAASADVAGDAVVAEACALLERHRTGAECAE